MSAMGFLKFLAATRRAAVRLIPLFLDRRVPLWLKIGTIATGLLVLSPLDPLSDIPILGLYPGLGIDDAALLALLANLFVMFADRSVMRNVTPRRSDVRTVGPSQLKP